MGLLRRATPSSTRKRVLLIGGGLLLAVVALGLLALPFRNAPSAAQDAKTDLEAAKGAISSGDFDQAAASVRSARGHADDVQDAMQGIGGDVWSRIPFVGRPVADVRHMGNALDELTSIAEIGVEALPLVNGEKGELFEEGAVDITTLKKVVDAAEETGTRLRTAQTELEQVRDSSPVIGTQVATARDQAKDVVDPLASDFARFEPLIDSMPSMLGADGRRTYLLALLNPSEQRFSGGAPLTIATMTVDNGELSLGEARDTTDQELFRPLKWRKVKGDRFIRGQQRLSTATYAPDWPVAGEELLRAWGKLTGEELDGAIGLDVVALGRLLAFSGPADVPMYGTLDSNNFAQKLIGDYDAYPDNEARKAANVALVPLFTDRLLAPGNEKEKLQSLYQSAQGRHFFMWMRDPDLHEGLAEARLAGDISESDNDYIAVFNQNTNVGKVDYWQKRSLSSAVRLNEDGSARVRLTVEVHNDSPPYLQPFPDPQGGTYFTRWNGMTLLTLLPRGVDQVDAVVAGERIEPSVLTYFDRPYARVRLVIPPRETRTAVLEYTVPAAAEVVDGDLVYSLDVTPQGMVVPQKARVAVTWPRGYSVEEAPEGWTARGRRAVYETDALDSQPRFTVTGKRSG